MGDAKRPYVWQMIKEALSTLGGSTTNVAVRDWILKHYPGTNTNTISAQIIVCTVNHPSRIHYPENKKPRVSNGSQDFIYRSGKGLMEQYDPDRHGSWSIVESEDGTLKVEAIGGGEEESSPPPALAGGFAAEDHLRDYLEANLNVIEDGLQLYTSEDERTGVEFVTPIGRIDILAVDKDGGLLVIELKVDRGPDYASAQLMRYMNWLRVHVAGNKRVRGCIIARNISDKIRYALADARDTFLMEYDMSILLKPVERVKLPPLWK